MKDGNTGIYKGVTYVAQDAERALGCKGCGGTDTVTGDVNLEFCNAMPDCMGADRRDKLDVVFVERKGETVSDTPRTDKHVADFAPSADPNYDGPCEWVPVGVARQLERELAEMTKKRDALHLMSLMSPIERCRTHHIQMCHCCEELDCGDNISPVKKRLADLEREACDMARATIVTCNFVAIYGCATVGKLRRCSRMDNKSCPARAFLAAHGDEKAWEVEL